MQLWLFALLVCACCADYVSQYNVRWSTVSVDSRGSMPIGNGDIGLNVWVQSDALYMYISKTDSFDENNRLLKVGKVKISLNPNPFASGAGFSQVLMLYGGVIQITANGIVLDVTVDANNPVVYVDVHSASVFSVQAELLIWRTVTRTITTSEATSAYGSCIPVVETADKIYNSSNSGVLWYHRNSNTPTTWSESLNLQGLGDFAKANQDPLLGTTFGGVLSLKNGKLANGNTLVGTGQSTYNISVVVLTDIASSSISSYANKVSALAKSLNLEDNASKAQKLQKHAQWWATFWDQSYVSSNPSGGPGVGSFFTLQRFMDACSGRGRFPIKFNGLIFTTDYFEENTFKYTADYRGWGGGWWFQNERFPFWTMLTNGDYEMIFPFFDMYMKMLPLAEARTRSWFGHDGAFFPETLWFWGTHLSGDYGCDRPRKPVWWVSNTWIRYHINGGLELIAMMLKYYDHTQDANFLQKYIIPMATAQLTYFQQHFPPNMKGIMILTPASVIETYQEAINPTPDIAGLHFTIRGLLALPGIPSQQKSDWSAMLSSLPPIPMGTDSSGATVIKPAEAYLQSTEFNSENGELYAVFPYPLYGTFNQTNINVPIKTYNDRQFKCDRGWCQDLLDAALLGMTEEAVRGLTARINTPLDAGYRFPSFYAKGFDFTPEEDHGAVGELGIQYMLMQTQGKAITLFPAWPKSWDVRFKFFAPYQTTVEVQCQGGKITYLNVVPATRRSDVKIAPNSCSE